MQYLEGTWSQGPIFFHGTSSNWVPNLYMPQLQCLYWALMSLVSVPDGCHGFPEIFYGTSRYMSFFFFLILAVYRHYICSASGMAAYSAVLQSMCNLVTDVSFQVSVGVEGGAIPCTRHTKPRPDTHATSLYTDGNIRRTWHMHRMGWLRRTLLCVPSWCAATSL